VLDLRDAATVRELGVDLDRLVGGRRAAQELADRARDIGAEGMIVPSAARHGQWNLVVFPSGFRRLAPTASSAVHPRPPR
jgi:hypothetical protein